MSYTAPTPFVHHAQQLIAQRLKAKTPDAKQHADAEFQHLFRMFGAGRFDEWLAAQSEVVDDSMAANPEEGF